MRVNHLLFLVMLMYCNNLLAGDSFVFESYRAGFLRMHLVTPSVAGRIFIMQGEQVVRINDGVLEDLFTLKVNIPCKNLQQKTKIYWMLVGKPPMSASIPAQTCFPKLKAVKIYSSQRNCIVNAGGNTLWSIANTLADEGHASVYQLMYGLLLANPQAFAGHDIHRLRRALLKCPDPNVLKELTPKHAYRLFQDSLQYKSGIT